VGPRFVLTSLYGYKRIAYTEPVALKRGKLAAKYPWIYGYFFAVQRVGLVVYWNVCSYIVLLFLYCLPSAVISVNESQLRPVLSRVDRLSSALPL